MSYKFSLQNVLEWRRDQEDEARINLLQAKEELESQEAGLQTLIRKNTELKEKSALNTSVEIMRQDDLYKKVLNENIIQQKLIVEQASNDVKQAEKLLVKAHQEKKVMGKLKEKEYQTYIDEMNAVEQKDLDEFAIITFGYHGF